MSRMLWAMVAALLALGMASRLEARRGTGQPAARPLPRAAAPVDLTGYWVSIVTQDWRWRMVTPAKGDYLGIPMTLAAKKVADAWDPAKDEAAGEQCRSYGAPALMSVPGRLHITWQDDSTLKVETDAGMQTRLLRFGPSTLREPQGRPEPGRGSTSSGPSRAASRDGDWQLASGTARTWQGVSVAQWQTSRANVPLLLRPAERSASATPPAGPTGGSLEVVTTNLRPGYLRKNGVPYSANTVLTEYWDLFNRPNGEQWLTITTQIEDPLYLREPRLIALPFKKEPNGAKWDPTPCSARW